MAQNAHFETRVVCPFGHACWSHVTFSSFHCGRVFSQTVTELQI